MECKKDDARKAKEIAERKLTEKDFSGAERFALKAQALYPGTEGLSQLMMIINVYLYAEKKVNKEVDWYGVLGETPSADDETLRKKYLKLALKIHPDKNKCIHADGAFKLVSEAWCLLSDKTKRLAYDQRNFTNTSTNNNVRPPPNSYFSTSCSMCKFPCEHRRIYLNATVRCSNCGKIFKAVETPSPSRPPFDEKRDKNDYFSTSCSMCKFPCEHRRIYLNETVRCSNCGKIFKAVETPSPSRPPFDEKRDKNDYFSTSCSMCKFPCEHRRIYFNETVRCSNCGKIFKAVETPSPSRPPFDEKRDKNDYFSTSCSMCKFPCEHRRIYLNETVRCSNCGKIFKAVETPSPSRPPFDEKRDKNDYFSTSCSMCKFPCEHRRIYLNETVRCSNCGKIFKAVETPSPSRPPFDEKRDKNDYFSTSCSMCKFPCEHRRIYFNETVRCSNCGKIFKAVETPSPSRPPFDEKRDKNDYFSTSCSMCKFPCEHRRIYLNETVRCSNCGKIFKAVETPSPSRPPFDEKRDKNDYFSTSCSMCKFPCEHRRIYLNETVRCSNCGKIFKAVETPSPSRPPFDEKRDKNDYFSTSCSMCKFPCEHRRIYFNETVRCSNCGKIFKAVETPSPSRPPFDEKRDKNDYFSTSCSMCKFPCEHRRIYLNETVRCSNCGKIFKAVETPSPSRPPFDEKRDKNDYFSTSCSMCKFPCEHRRIYLNETVRCSNCGKIFKAVETPSPSRPPFDEKRDKNDYFSTSCSMCKFPCEHRRIYLNETVRCSNCGKIFKAVETPSPSRPPFDEKRDKNDYFSTSCSMCKFPCEHRRIYFNETVRCSNCGKIFKAVETPSPSRPPFDEKRDKNDYFSTSCSMCKFPCEHRRIYLNETVRCSNCGKIFKAVETPSPSRPPVDEKRDKNDYFSTSCSMCKFPCEHRRIYLNETVRCSNCGKIFKAVETPSPSRPPFDEKRDKNDYFSTSCSMCKFPCEHRRIYLNATVRCSNCGKIFKAVETPSPSRPPFNENGNKNSYFSTSCPTCKFCFKHLRIYVNETVLCSHCGKKFKAAETPSPSWNYHNKSKTADVPLPKMSKTPDVPLPKMSKTLDVPLPKMSPLFFSSSCTGVAKKAAPYVVQQAANNNNTKRARKEEAAQGQRVNKHPKMSSTEELTTPCEMPKTEFHPQTINPVPPGAF